MPSGGERQFGDFILLLKLGWGGMADVFLAKKRGDADDAFVVIKRLKPDLAFDPEHRAMFDAEAKLAMRFDHPNVVRALGHGEVDDLPYLVLEYLEGQTLDRVIGEPGLSANVAIEVVRALLAGLEYAHQLTDERGERLDVVHRDVSPHNVFVTLDGRVKLVDFGIAKSKLGSQHTVTGVVKGKLAYMAPEQALANVVDRRADLFATGVVLWELVTGSRYWGALTDVQILKAMTFGELPKPPPTLDPEIARVLASALTVTPEQRYPSASAFVAGLASLVRAPVPAAALGAAVQRVARTDPESVRHLARAQLAEPIPPPSASTPGAASFDTAPLPSSIIETTDGQELPLAEPSRAPSSGLRARLPWIGAAVAVVAAIVLVIVRFAGPVTPPNRTVDAASPNLPAPPTASAAASASAPVPSAPRDPRDQITVRVIASPASARIQLDGVDVAANPFVAKFPRDGAAHKLLVSASGYAESAELVVFDKDVAIERHLLAVRPSGSASSSRPSSSGSSTGPHVDNRDPWAPRPK